MMYSCALWSDAEDGVRGDIEFGPRPGDLEAAQLRKIHYVLRKARVKPGHRVLEFGSGWGGLSIEVRSALFLFLALAYIFCIILITTQFPNRLPGASAVKSIR